MNIYLKRHSGNHRKYLAFTLAEVLITLLIIGVISSIVIPALISNTQDAELKTAWKKTYSDIDLATRRIVMDNAGSLRALTITNDQFRDLYLAYLSYVKKCDSTSMQNCWTNGITAIAGDSFPDNSSAILNNGVMLNFDYDSSTCTSVININSAAGIINVCGSVNVDVNGSKGPNKIGKDVFGIYILENSTKPFGSQGDNQENTCSTTGVGCAAQYLYQ
ncbi:MAG: prepilin-type N-terminal cleavage/methylation domain-containing protein [Candidatus Gastranaerophilales bacterium]|nr:prepilin-type N-terminal cleavage/methylation domain-containing protein [Candidatus Gastranaerophilales bacterium]